MERVNIANLDCIMLKDSLPLNDACAVECSKCGSAIPCLELQNEKEEEEKTREAAVQSVLHFMDTFTLFSSLLR